MHTGAAREQNGAARGAERLHRRRCGRSRRLQAAAVPGDDEQGIVDAHAEPDQRAEDRRDAVHDIQAWVSGAIAISPLPTPAMAATTSAAAIANSEPNAMNNMTAAATTPIADATRQRATARCRDGVPADLDREPGSRAPVGTATTRLISALSRSSDGPGEVDHGVRDAARPG